MDDQFVEMMFPVQGVDVASSPYGGGKPSTADVATNVRAHDVFKKRQRGGSRPGMVRYVTERLPNWVQGGEIQHLSVIVDPQADALLVTFEEIQAELFPDLFLDDPSTNFSTTRIRNPGRMVRRGGSGAQSNINIPKRRPVITWENPADISAGTPLSGTQLNAIASDPFTGIAVAGTFVYTPPSGTVLSAGENQALRTAFTPTNTSQYRTATKTVMIDVGGSTPSNFEVFGYSLQSENYYINGVYQEGGSSDQEEFGIDTWDADAGNYDRNFSGTPYSPTPPLSPGTAVTATLELELTGPTEITYTFTLTTTGYDFLSGSVIQTGTVQIDDAQCSASWTLSYISGLAVTPVSYIIVVEILDIP